jgi:hypothetical protein
VTQQINKLQFLSYPRLHFKLQPLVIPSSTKILVQTFTSSYPGYILMLSPHLCVNLKLYVAIRFFHRNFASIAHFLSSCYAYRPFVTLDLIAFEVWCEEWKLRNVACDCVPSRSSSMPLDAVISALFSTPSVLYPCSERQAIIYTHRKKQTKLFCKFKSSL